MSSAPPGRPARHRRLQLPVLVWLTAVWVLLWGDLSVGNVLAGLVLGVAVCLVFPMPPLTLRIRIRPLWLAWLVLRFLSDVLLASIEVAVKTLQLRQPRNAVIEVDLRTQSDFVLTVVAEMVSLVPGSLVVEARAATHTLFLHVLDVGDRAGAERFRERVLALERRVVLALGKETSPVRGSARSVSDEEGRSP